MRTFHLISLSDSSAQWTLQPGTGFLEERQALRARHRSRSGVLLGESGSAHYRARIPLAFVESGLREAIAAWWRVQARLVWTEIGPAGPVSAIVRIGDPAQPLGRRQRAAELRYAGSLRLEGIGRDGDRVYGAPLILDHETFGTLDTHNVLL